MVHPFGRRDATLQSTAVSTLQTIYVCVYARRLPTIQEDIFVSAFTDLPSASLPIVSTRFTKREFDHE
jgi:hypothetical protein